MPNRPTFLDCSRCGRTETMRMEAETRNGMTMQCVVCNHMVEVDGATLKLLDPVALGELRIRLARAGLADPSGDVWRHLDRIHDRQRDKA